MSRVVSFAERHHRRHHDQRIFLRAREEPRRSSPECCSISLPRPAALHETLGQRPSAPAWVQVGGCFPVVIDVAPGQAAAVTVTRFLTIDDVIAANRDAFGSGVVASRLLYHGLGGVFIVRSFRWASWLPRMYRVSEVLRDGQLDSVAVYVRSESAHHRARCCAP